MSEVTVKYKKLRKHAQPPTYMSAGAAGADLAAYLDRYVQIESGSSYPIPTGISVEIPDGYVGLVIARSGVATKRGLAPANKVGVIDSDFRGEVIVWLHNQSRVVQTVGPGERIAQLVVVPAPHAVFEKVEELAATDRGEAGFGSTGE